MIIPAKIIAEIEKEFEFATSKFGSFNSAHEGYAVILEELDELKAEIFKKFSERDNDKMHKEALQVATMAIRFIVDIVRSK